MARISQKIRDIVRRVTPFAGTKTQAHDIALVKRVRNKRMPSLRQFLRIRSLFTTTQRRIFSIAFLVFVLSGFMSIRFVAQGYQVDVPKVKGSYTEGEIGSPQLMNPLFSSLNDADQDIVSLVYSGLMRYDETRSLVPDLAVNYHVSDDNKTYTFTLKENVIWHDGEHFTADDVVYTYDMVADSQVGSPLAPGFHNVTIEKVDDYTVQFTLPDTFPSFLASLTMGILPEHIWGSIPATQIRLANRNVNPIGTGPFKFSELFKDQTGYIHRVELERFDDFYRKAPYIKEFNFEYFNDYDGPTGIVSALREKRIEGVHFVPYDMREKIARKHITLHTLQLPQYTALFFNMDASQLEERDVREGLVHALDRERIIREVLSNEAKRINGPILEGFPGYRADTAGYDFSIEDANALLDDYYTRISADDYRSLLHEEKLQALIDAEKERITKEAQPEDTNTSPDENAGDTVPATSSTTSSTPQVDEEALGKIVDEELNRTLDQAQLFYRYPKGGSDKKDILSLDLVTVSRPEYIKVAELVAGYWQDIGIKVTISLVDAQDLSRDILKDRKYDVLLYGVIVGNDPDQYPFWHSSQTGYPGLNLSQYESDDLDTILEDIRAATTREEQDTLYHDFEDTLIADVPAAFLYTPTYTYALTDAIQGFSMTRISRPSDRFADVTNWYLYTKREWQWK